MSEKLVNLWFGGFFIASGLVLLLVAAWHQSPLALLAWVPAIPGLLLTMGEMFKEEPKPTKPNPYCRG